MRSDVDDRSEVFVSLYRCRRNLSTARSQGTWEWKLECNTSAPLHIVLHVQKSAMVSPNILVTCNRNTIYPQGWTGDSSIRKPGLILRDFQHSWSMRGTVVGMRMERAIEIRPLRNGREQWFVGTLLNHHLDGSFDVSVETYDQFGEPQEEFHSSVSTLDLRYADSKRPLHVCEHKIFLFVPYNNPVEDAYLSIDGTKFNLSLLAKPSPPQTIEDLPQIIIQVPRHSDMVTANVGRSALLNYKRCSGVTNTCEMIGFGSSSWILQIGHAQHRVDVSRKSKSSKDVTLEVDGEVLVEASKTELGCVKENWECSFLFFGEHSLSFHLVHTSAAGNAVGQPYIIQQRSPFEHLCKVEVHDIADLSTSTLYVDGVVFRSLPVLQRASSEQRTHLSLQDLRFEYNITVPDGVSQFAQAKEVVAENTKVPCDPPTTTAQPLASCYCCENVQTTLDISSRFNSLLTTLNWEGSRILDPVSRCHPPPASMPCSREGSVPRSLATSPRLEDDDDAITPREVAPPMTPEALADDVHAVKPRQVSKIKMPVVPPIDWTPNPRILTPTTPKSPLSTMAQVPQHAVSQMSQIATTPLTTMAQPPQHAVSQTSQIPTTPLTTMAQPPQHAVSQTPQIPMTPLTTMAQQPQHAASHMSKIREEKEQDNAAAGAKGSKKAKKVEERRSADEERHQEFGMNCYWDALPFTGDHWPDHWGGLPTPLASSRLSSPQGVAYPQGNRNHGGMRNRLSFLTSGTAGSSSFSLDRINEKNQRFSKNADRVFPAPVSPEMSPKLAWFMNSSTLK